MYYLIESVPECRQLNRGSRQIFSKHRTIASVVKSVMDRTPNFNRDFRGRWFLYQGAYRTLEAGARKVHEDLFSKESPHWEYARFLCLEYAAESGKLSRISEDDLWALAMTHGGK